MFATVHNDAEVKVVRARFFASPVVRNKDGGGGGGGTARDLLDNRGTSFIPHSINNSMSSENNEYYCI